MGGTDGAVQKRRWIGKVEKEQLGQISVFPALEVMAVIMV